MSTSENTDHEHGELGHIVPFKIYAGVFLALIMLTAMTVLIAKHPFFQFDADWINVVIAIGIATLKASLVAMFFMHLKYENSLIMLYVFFPLFLLALLIGILFLDNPWRVGAGEGSTIEVSAAVDQRSSRHIDI